MHCVSEASEGFQSLGLDAPSKEEEGIHVTAFCHERDNSVTDSRLIARGGHNRVTMEGCTHPLLDVSRLVARASRAATSGIDRVLLEYSAHFVNVPEAQFVYFSEAGPRRLPRWFVKVLVDRLRTRWASPSTRPAMSRWNSMTRSRRAVTRLAWTASRRDFEHGHYLYVNVGHRHWHRHRELQNILAERLAGSLVMVHDLMPLTIPWNFPEGLRADFEKGLHDLAQYRTLFIANSKTTRDELRQQLRAPCHPRLSIVDVPLGVRIAQPAPGSTVELTRMPHFSFVGSLDPRKNTELLQRVWRRLSRTMTAPPQLFLIGTRERHETRITPQIMAPGVRHLEGLSDAEVAAVVGQSRALLLPSRAEGYGLPVAEALALGTPVVCSDLPALREVGGAVPRYLASDDDEAWYQAVVSLTAADSSEAIRQSEARASHVVPTWQGHFRQLNDAVRDWLDSGPASSAGLPRPAEGLPPYPHRGPAVRG